MAEAVWLMEAVNNEYFFFYTFLYYSLHEQ